MTVQPSIVSPKLKRTKIFFGYRYMWTRCQLSEPCSYFGAGVRKDVARAPEWTHVISSAMIKENLVEKDFINYIAINVYYDGKEGSPSILTMPSGSSRHLFIIIIHSPFTP